MTIEISRKTLAIVQTRATSSRLPDKGRVKIGPYFAIELMSKRLKRATFLDEIVYAVPDNQANQNYADWIQNTLGLQVFRGSEEDVLLRYADCARTKPSRYIVRLTGDCPFVCPEIVDGVVKLALERKVHYAANVNPTTFADGFDVEVVSSDLLNWMNEFCMEPGFREHVTMGVTKGMVPPWFSNETLLNEFGDQSALRITLDTKKDLEFMNVLAKRLEGRLAEVDYSDLQRELVLLSKSAR